MSEEGEGSKRFSFSVKADSPAEMHGKVMGEVLQVRASVEALAGLLIVALGKDEEGQNELLSRYTKARQEALLQVAFSIQDSPPTGAGGEGQGSSQ